MSGRMTPSSAPRRAIERRPLKDRLWWFDVVYPMTVAVLLFSSLTYIVYSGQSSSRLSLRAEQVLLEFSLGLGRGRAIQRPGEVVLVTADALDVRRLGRAPLGTAPDASAVVYSQLIRRLAEDGVGAVYIRWDPDAHPTDDVYYLPLVEALSRLPATTTVYFVVPANRLESMPLEFSKIAHILDDGACRELNELSSDCAFDATMKDWVIPAIVMQAYGPKQPPEDASWLTGRLPSILPDFILNLSDPATLPQVRFSDILGGRSHLDGTRVRMAFVGVDLSHSLAIPSASPAFRFVRTVYDPSDVDVQVAGTPVHAFWASLAQMVRDDALVRVPSERVSVVTTAALCIMIIVVMAAFGGPAAAGMFLIYALSAPVINAFGMKVMNVYVPYFDTLYFGMSTFIVAGFSRLSLTAFQRWRLDEQRRLHVLTADLKGNFISLLSHNLNTPVAKMQGMLGILSGQPGEADWKSDVRLAERHVAQLEHAIRSVLIASALEEGSVTETARSVTFLAGELGKTMGGSLRRLGVQCTVAPPEAEADDLLYVPMAFDVRALHAAVAALAALFATDQGHATVTITFVVTTETDDPRLSVHVDSPDAWIPEGAIAILSTGVAQPVRRLQGASFLPDVLAGLAVLTVALYRGRIELQPSATGGRLTAFLAPRPADGLDGPSTAWH